MVVTLSGRRVGIIGYVTTDTTEISNPDKVRFMDEVETIDKEATRLKGIELSIDFYEHFYQHFGLGF